MKISFIAENDFANVLTEYSYCLNKHGENIESKSICFRPHPFNYKIQHDYDLESCSVGGRQEAKKFIEESDVIIFGEEGHPLEPTYRTLREFGNLLDLNLLNSNKKLCIWHPGSHYRQNYNFYNNHPLRDKIYKHFYTMGLYRLSPKNKDDYPLFPYQYNNFNFQNYIENFSQKLNSPNRLITHIPSKPGVKGTYEINQIINSINLSKYNFNYEWYTQITNTQSIDIKKTSLIYIDQFSPKLQGGYGIASFEAILNSNITFSTINSEVYEAFHKITNSSEIPVIPLGNTIKEMDINLNHYLKLPNDSLYEISYNKGKWVDNHLTPKNIVKFILSLIK